MTYPPHQPRVSSGPFERRTPDPEPEYRTPTHVNERTAALHLDGTRIVLALDALVNEMRAQTRAIEALTEAVVNTQVIP